MRDEKEERKKQARSSKQTRQSNTAHPAHPRQSLFLEKMSCLRWDSNPRHSIRQHSTPSTPKAVTFPRKNELPQVGLEPTTLYTLDRALYQLSYRGSSAGWAQISHLIVHLMNRLTINISMYTLYLCEVNTILLFSNSSENVSQVVVSGLVLLTVGSS